MSNPALQLFISNAKKMRYVIYSDVIELKWYFWCKVHNRLVVPPQGELRLVS